MRGGTSLQLSIAIRFLRWSYCARRLRRALDGNAFHQTWRRCIQKYRDDVANVHDQTMALLAGANAF